MGSGNRLWSLAVMTAALGLGLGCAVEADGGELGSACATECGDDDEPGSLPDGADDDSDGQQGPDDGNDDDGADNDPASDDGREPDPTDSGGDDGNDGKGDSIDPSDPACCGLRHDACLAGGGSTSQCDGLLEICDGGSCEGLVALCDPTAIPVSAACARAYHACFGIRINKCQRTNYAQCVNRLGDEELCAAWDASCEARFELCADRLDCSYHEPNAGSDPEDEAEPKVDEQTCTPPGMYYECTDWGHEFEPCWPEYESCSGSVADCEQQLRQCTNEIDGNLNGACDGHGTMPDPMPGDDQDGPTGEDPPAP